MKTLITHLLRTLGLAERSPRRGRRRPLAVPTRLTVESFEDRVVPSAAGLLDLSFGSGGKTTTSFLLSPHNDRADDVAVQRDGKIVVVGSLQWSSSGNYDFGIARYHSSGILDSSFDDDGRKLVYFDVGGNRQDHARAVAIDHLGRIVVAGTVDVSSTNSDFAVIRLLPDGNLDLSFGTGGKVRFGFDLGGSGIDLVTDVTIDERGRIVVAGSAEGDSFNYDFAVARLTDSGSLDSSFSGDGRALVAFNRGGLNLDTANAVAVDSAGRIVLAGSAQRTSAGDFDMAVARLNASGNLDTSFSGDGKALVAFNVGGSRSDVAYGVATDGSNRIVLGGSATTAAGVNFAVARLTSSGGLDGSFSGDGRLHFSFNRSSGSRLDHASDVAIDHQGRIVLAGDSLWSGGDRDFAVARVRSNGALDTSFSDDGRSVVAFDLGGSFYDVASGVAIDHENRIVLAGSARVTDGNEFAVARVDSGAFLEVTDASGDSTEDSAFRNGAIRVSYDFPTLPAGTSISSLTVEATRGGVTRVLASYTASLFFPIRQANTLVVNLASVSGLSNGTYSVSVRAVLSSGAVRTSASDSLTLRTGGTTVGTFEGQTLTYSPSGGQAQVFRGRGGTDTLFLDTVLPSHIASINGLSWSVFQMTRSTDRQAIYRGSAYDSIRLTNGREIYFQGIERLRFDNGTTFRVAVQPNDPEFDTQWNLHVTDVPSAWRFNTGGGNVMLMSLDTGLLTPSGGSGSVHDISSSRRITDSGDDDNTTGGNYGHGHKAVSVMASTANNGTHIAGVNWTSDVIVGDVYGSNGQSLQAAITTGISTANIRGARIVFQGGIQGESWLTDGGTQAELEALFTGSEDMALFAIAAGNGGQDISLTSNSAYSAGVARLSATHDNVLSVGALQRTGTTVNGMANASAVNRASYSNYGSQLTLMGPTDSPAATKFDETASFGGTSCANPNVAGIASLVWEANPTLAGATLRQVIVDTCMDLGATGRDNTYGEGLINADAAVRRASALMRDSAVALLVPHGSSSLA